MDSFVFLPNCCTISDQSMVNKFILIINQGSHGHLSITHRHLYMPVLPGNPWDQCKLFSSLQQLSKETGSDKDFIDVTKNVHSAKI